MGHRAATHMQSRDLDILELDPANYDKRFGGLHQESKAQ
jgi:hypothetical protein